MAVCACWPRWASVSKPPELSLSHSSLVTRMFWRFLWFSLPGLLLFFDFLIFGSTCKFKWFTILLWCYCFKTLQKSSTKSTTKGFFLMVFPSYLHNLGIFFHQVILPTPQIRWRLRPRHAGRATLDPICYESTTIMTFFGEGCFGVQGFLVFFWWPNIWRQNLRRVDAFGDSILFSVLHVFMVRWKGRGEQRAVWRAVFPSLCCSMPLSSVVHDPRVCMISQ